VAVLTIDADYDFTVELLTGTYTKYTAGTTLAVGSFTSGKSTGVDRLGFDFSLANLPSGATITQVRLKVTCMIAGGASHLTDIHAYGTNGQEDPEPDDAQTCYTRCASGNLYYDDATDLRTTGTKWFILSGSIITDVGAAKTAVNRFALAMHEEGDNDTIASITAIEYGTPSQLEITYEAVGISIPVAMHHYMQMTKIRRG